MTKHEGPAASTRTVALKSVGADVALELGGSSAEALAAAVRDSWAWCLAPSGSTTDPVAGPSRLEAVLDDDPAVIAEAHRRGAIAASDCDTVMHLLAPAITVAGIDQQAGQLLMLHAAAIADPTTGRAVVAVAASGGGKTTFVRTAGGDRVYLTDEAVALTDDHSIVPYPKPLSVHTAGQNLKAHTRPDHFGLLRPTGDYTMAALWSLERSAGPTRARLEPIPRLEAITTLAPQVSYLSSLPTPLHRVAAAVDAAGGMFRAVYHEAEDLEPMVRSGLGTQR